MLRIAIFSTHYAEYACRQALALSKSNKVMLVINAENVKQEVEAKLLQTVENASSVLLLKLNTYRSRKVAYLSAMTHLLRFRPEILHVHEQADALTAVLIRQFRFVTRIVMTIHDPQPHSGRDSEYAKRWADHRLRLRGLVSAYHVHGNYCASTLAANDPYHKLIINTPHGVILVPGMRGLPVSNYNRILFFGRMEEYKGIDVLLDAVKDLEERNIEFELTLAGTGPELVRLNSEIASVSNIRLIHQYLTPDAAITEFQRAAVVVVPYRNATQSGVVAAAFANGRPVIASRVGGLADIVEHEFNGILVSPDSSLELSSAISRVLGDKKLLMRLADGAETSGRYRLSWSAIAEDLQNGYLNVLNSRRSL